MIKKTQWRCFVYSTLMISLVIILDPMPSRAQACKALVADDSYPVYTKLSEAMKNPDQVVKLKLTGRKMKEIPVEVWQLTQLQELDLSGNRIEVIPDEIAALKQLRILKMERNRIHTVTDSLGALTSLRVLMLGRNALCVLPASLTDLSSLECLDLWKNEIGRLPVGIKKLSEHLKIVDLRHNPFPKEAIEALKTGLPETEILTTRGCACNGS